MSNYDKIRCDICEQSLTLQFLETHRQLLANSLGVDEFDVEEHRNIPKEPQDEGVPEHNVDFGAGSGQPCDVTTGLQCDVTLSFDLSIDQSTTPAPEPGPSNVPRLHPVFEMGPDSEVEENDEGNDEPEGSDGDCVRFQADIKSESEDNETHGICLDDPRLARGEEARQLDVEQQLRV